MSDPVPERGELIRRGKAKSIYATSRPDQVIVQFRDDLTAFNGRKRAEVRGKGTLNSRISALLFLELERSGVPTHFVQELGPGLILARRAEIVPLEIVVRNQVAGSLSRRLGLPEGRPLPQPVIEHYYKRDDLGDPILNRDHIRVLGLAADSVVDEMEELARRANQALLSRFARAGIELVDLKLEFGLVGGQLVVADELSPDTLRAWDAASGERLDKDRFRRDLGPVLEGYETILSRLEAGSDAGGPGAGGQQAENAGGKAQKAARDSEEDRLPARWAVEVRIMPKEGMLDPQGKAVGEGLRAMGYGEVEDVRVGKSMALALKLADPAFARQRTEEMCRRLLANPVVEEFEISSVSRMEGRS
ncbi:MAG: phosphoribosylaminoimidazolesuccinocarboxamide synthase [Firmicutes bacterium]|nr:phosphoribosylaminoimidazolesuccinocarboxamide synthase [Bacillota bacterium]